MRVMFGFEQSVLYTLDFCYDSFVDTLEDNLDGRCWDYNLLGKGWRIYLFS